MYLRFKNFIESCFFLYLPFLIGCGPPKPPPKPQIIQVEPEINIDLQISSEKEKGEVELRVDGKKKSIRKVLVLWYSDSKKPQSHYLALINETGDKLDIKKVFFNYCFVFVYTNYVCSL